MQQGLTLVPVSSANALWAPAVGCNSASHACGSGLSLSTVPIHPQNLDAVRLFRLGGGGHPCACVGCVCWLCAALQCVEHTENLDMASSTTVDGFSYKQSLTTWFFGTGATPRVLSDACNGPSCNPTCTPFRQGHGRQADLEGRSLFPAM